MRVSMRIFLGLKITKFWVGFERGKGVCGDVRLGGREMPELEWVARFGSLIPSYLHVPR